MMRRLAAALLLCALGVTAAVAQSTCPPIIYGAVLTAAQWQACFQAKQDTLGYQPLNRAGDSMLGRLSLFPSAAGSAGLNLGVGLAPSSPHDGDLWMATGGVFYQNGGVIYGPLGAAVNFAGTSPINVAFPGGIVTYSFDFTVANTFLAQQTDQGATTTSPGWYAQIAGDTTPRMRVGVNATDIPSIAFGPGNAVRDTFIERFAAANIRLGAPDAAAPVAQTLSVQNVSTGTTNTAGANLTISGSRGTGTGTGGAVVFKFAPAGSTGSAQNALAETARVGAGLMVGTTTDPGAGISNVLTGYRIGNAAGNAHYLRGDGTNFIDSTIQTGDVTTSQLVAMAPGPLPIGATRFLTVTTFWATNTQAYMQSPFANTATIRRMYINLSADPGNTQTMAFTIYVNGSTTAVTCTVTGNGSSNQTCTDTTHTAALSQGQNFTVQYVGSGGANTGIYANVVFEIDNSG